MADEHKHQINVECKNCGQAFTAFLEQIAEHNLQVTCPCCGQSQEITAPGVKTQ